MCVTNILNLILHNCSNHNNFWHRSCIAITNAILLHSTPTESIKQVLILCGPNYTCEFQTVWSMLILQKTSNLQSSKVAT